MQTQATCKYCGGHPEVVVIMEGKYHSAHCACGAHYPTRLSVADVEWSVANERPLNRTSLEPLKEYEPDQKDAR